VKRNNRQAFTLVELLVVIGIIAVLISILLPALSKARVAALQTQCLSRHRQIMLALVQYTQDNDGWGPASSETIPAGKDPQYPTSAVNIRWQNLNRLGRYLGNRSYKSDTTNTTMELYCPVYKQAPVSYNSDDLGIGINIRYGNKWFRDQNGRIKFTTVKNASDVITFADVYSGYCWEKYYFNENSPYNSLGGNGTGMVEYRHGLNTVVSFADGHSSVFTRNAASSTYMNTGLHAAYQANEVTALPSR